MTIQYFAYLRDVTGCKQEQLSGASNLRALLRLLCEKHGDALREKLYTSVQEGVRPARQDLGQKEPEREIDGLGREGDSSERENLEQEELRQEGGNPEWNDLGQDELGNVIIMVNGRHINHLGGISTILTDSDTVQIFPVVAGG